MPRSFFSIKIIPILIFTFSHGKENPIDPSILEYKIANATRIHSPIIIDGYLDEDAWKNKLTITDFSPHQRHICISMGICAGKSFIPCI